MKIFDKMVLLAISLCIGLDLVLSTLHVHFIIVCSVPLLLLFQCIMLGAAWQREDEANKVTKSVPIGDVGDREILRDE